MFCSLDKVRKKAPPKSGESGIFEEFICHRFKFYPGISLLDLRACEIEQLAANGVAPVSLGRARSRASRKASYQAADPEANIR